MAKISFSKEFKPRQNVRLDKLSLEKGERARIALIAEPEAQFVHTLNKLVLDENTGQALMEVKTTQKGDEYSAPATEYAGRFACTGEFDTVQEKGVDPDNCPFCAAAEESGAFDSPRRYIAQLVFQYVLQPNSFKIQDKPFMQGKVIPWVYTDAKYSKLYDLNEELSDDDDSAVGDAGIFGVDLMLGPCESGTYQNYDIQATRKLEWAADKSRKEYVEDLRNAYEGDITTLFGKVATPAEAKRVIFDVQAAFDAANNPHGQSNDRLRSSSSEAVDTMFSGGAKDDGEEAYEPVENVDTSEEEDKSDASEVRSLSDLINF